MSFQSAVGYQYGQGVPGEISHEAPQRARPVRLAATSAANNIIGAVALFYILNADDAAAPDAAGVGAFAGFLSNPKVYASSGDFNNGGSLAPTMVLPNNLIVEALEEGMMYVKLTTTGKIGDLIYANATGQLVAVAPGVAPPANSRATPAKIARFNVGAAGLALIHSLDGIQAPVTA